MKIIFFTKSKEFTLKFLRDISEAGHCIWVVCKDYSSFIGTSMENYCKEKDIKYLDHEGINELLRNNKLPRFDLGISNTYGRLIKKELIEWLRGKIINIHGAILPTYKGAFTYNWGLYNLEKEWGVTAHFVNEKFDEGDIICVKRFAIDPKEISVAELERKTQETAYNLSIELVNCIEKGIIIESTPQTGGGGYYGREDFEKLKKINMQDDCNQIDKRIHACWCPPYEGAYIELDGKKYFLINREILEKL